MIAVHGDHQVFPAIGLVDAHRQRLEIVLQLVARGVEHVEPRDQLGIDAVRVGAHRRRRERRARRRLDALRVERQLAADLGQVHVLGEPRAHGVEGLLPDRRALFGRREGQGEPDDRAGLLELLVAILAADEAHPDVAQKGDQIGRHGQHRRRRHLLRLRVAVGRGAERVVAREQRVEVIEVGHRAAQQRLAADLGQPRAELIAVELAERLAAVGHQHRPAELGADPLGEVLLAHARRPADLDDRRAPSVGGRAEVRHQLGLLLRRQPRVAQHPRRHHRGEPHRRRRRPRAEQIERERAIDLDAQRLQRHIARRQRILDRHQRVLPQPSFGQQQQRGVHRLVQLAGHQLDDGADLQRRSGQLALKAAADAAEQRIDLRRQRGHQHAALGRAQPEGRLDLRQAQIDPRRQAGHHAPRDVQRVRPALVLFARAADPRHRPRAHDRHLIQDVVSGALVRHDAVMNVAFQRARL